MSYTWPGMVKLNKLQALWVWRNNKGEVFMLFDDSESLVGNESEIWNHCGDFGMEIPTAKPIDLVFITEWLVKVGTTKTTSGSWYVSFDEVASKFGLDVEYIKENAKAIAAWLDKKHEEIISETWLDDGGFDMNFGLAYCPNVEEDGIWQEDLQ